MSKLDKKTRLEIFKEFVKGRDQTKGKEYEQEPITGMALKIVTDGKLENRLIEYNKLLELLDGEIKSVTVREYILELIDMLKTTHSCILRIGGVYARSGDNPKFAKMMRGWDKLYSNTLSKCLRSLWFWGNNPNEKIGTFESMNEVNVKNLHLAMVHLTFNSAFDVLNYCFRDDDVRERSVTMIQSMNPMMPRGGGLNRQEELKSDDY